MGRSKDLATGSITTDFTVDTDTLKVDSSNDRVLINTTTAGRAAEGADQLTIEAADDGHSGLTIRSGSSSYGSINFSDSAGGAGEYQASIFMLHGTDTLTLATAGSDRVKIDSSGRVTKPSTPHMLAQGYKERYGTTDRHLFHTVTTNTGNHWNNTNGKFTCPVAGTYLVTAFSGYKQADNYAGIGIGYNGSVLSFGWTHPTDDRHGHQNVTIMKNASANDYFYYYAQTSYTTPISAANNEFHAHLSVYLLG